MRSDSCGEESKQKLNHRLNQIRELLSKQPEIEFTYFVPDEKKTGGEYVTCNGIVRKMDLYQRIILLMDGTRIPIDEIIDIDGKIFLSAEYE